MTNKANDLIHTQPAFIDAIAGLPAFVLDTNADLDMAYDWVADQAECGSFVHQQEAWDAFYDAFNETILFD